MSLQEHVGLPSVGVLEAVGNPHSHLSWEMADDKVISAFLCEDLVPPKRPLLSGTMSWGIQAKTPEFIELGPNVALLVGIRVSHLSFLWQSINFTNIE